MDIQPWDEVLIKEDSNGWKNLQCICDRVTDGVAYLWHLKFPAETYKVTVENRNRVEIIKNAVPYLDMDVKDSYGRFIKDKDLSEEDQEYRRMLDAK